MNLNYFSLIESYPGLGNAYLSNLKNTLMNMGYTAAGWTYLADEHHIYGSSRVGVHNTKFVLAKRFSTAEMEYTQKTGNQIHFIRGKRNYELSNHLGNVQVVISDKRISVCDNELQTERFEADILMATDYYPFGMAIPERQWYTGSDSANYRFGFNGKEIDREHGDAGNSYDYGFRVYNPTLGRFLSVDPLCRTYPWYSPYQFAGNKPIWAIDVDGLEEYIYQYSIDDNHNVTLIKKERNVEMREKINPSGLHSGIYEAYNKRTGEKLTDDERGKVQYEYFYKGKKIDIHRKVNGEFAEGAGEMMSLHQENYDGSIYISSPFGKDAKVGDDYDYRREPTDLADAAALSHDKAYDQVEAAGTLDALTNPETILADIQLLIDVQKIIDNYGNKDFVDPYTNKPISEQTYNRAQTIKTIFTGIVINKIKNSVTIP